MIILSTLYLQSLSEPFNALDVNYWDLATSLDPDELLSTRIYTGCHTEKCKQNIIRKK